MQVAIKHEKGGNLCTTILLQLLYVVILYSSAVSKISIYACIIWLNNMHWQQSPPICQIWQHLFEEKYEYKELRHATKMSKT